MKNIINVKLSFLDGETNSQLKTKVYEEELESINSKFPLEENQVDIKLIYLVVKDNVLETESFIRNGLNKNISLENLFFNIMDKNGNTVATTKVNFKDYGVIAPFSAKPYIIKFELDRSNEFNENEDYFINFTSEDELKAFPSVAAEIENIPIDISFEEEKAIRSFATNLQTLKKGEFSISVYKIGYNKNKCIDCTLLFRNGSNKLIDIKVFPLSLLNENGELIVRKEFKNENRMLSIKPEISKLITVEFKENELPTENIDFTKCIIEYR